MSKSFTIHDLPKDERPRERLVKFGSSGDPEPSEDDLLLTKKLVESGKILGIW